MTNKPSANAIVPQPVQDELIALADVGDDNEYRTGDIVCEQEEENTVVKPDGTRTFRIPMSQLYAALGQHRGKSGDTMRDWGYVSRRVTFAIRESYDMLFRSHHKAIADYAKGDEVEHARLCDEWLKRSADYGGSIGTVEALRLWLDTQNGAPSRWNMRLRRVVRALHRLEEDEDAPVDVRHESGKAMIELDIIYRRINGETAL